VLSIDLNVNEEKNEGENGEVIYCQILVSQWISVWLISRWQ